ncbi:fimbria/pilus outer membrane usher protein [Klebsiella aerogenes]
MILSLKKLHVAILAALHLSSLTAQAVEFNTDILDASDRNNIDLSRFSQTNYIMPGTYTFVLRLNNHEIEEQQVKFIEYKSDADASNVSTRACLTPKQVALLGFKEAAHRKVTFDRAESCADFSALEGVHLRGDLSSSTLFISIPQAWLEYQDSNWLPPSRWEEGINGVLLDYNVNVTASRPNKGSMSNSTTANGTLGANLGPWRLRGDWQGQHERNDNTTRNAFDWSRLYAYRAVPSLMAQMILGETFLTSDLFDSWRFTGAALLSDESQLPPKLRGYAPEVTGIARTNAKVTISQQDRVLSETTVAAGPFRIQDLNSAVNGILDVRVEEQDGSVQTFQVTTATIPYLTRPGQVRYKLSAGQPSGYDHDLDGPVFASGEMSWGISNNWSLYGGGILSEDYGSLAVGIGRDLYQFGAISADITQSMARLPSEGEVQGRSYRLSYSKRFDELNSDLTFAGYRFSEREFLSMPEYLDVRQHGNRDGNSKSLYTVTASKSFIEERLSLSLAWSHQTYWDRADTDRYSLTTSRYFDWGKWRNLSATLSASRSDYNGRRDDTAWLSLRVPFGQASASYNGTWNNKRYSQTVGWNARLGPADSYRLNAGTRSGSGETMTTQMSGFYSHDGEQADVTANLGWAQNDYFSGGLSLSGGITVTAQGGALHGNTSQGATRILVSADGVKGVPVGRRGKTNLFGYAIEPSVASYHVSRVEIDVNRLPDNVEVAGPTVAEAALTEGAIGFREFDVLKGEKLMATLRLANGKAPPFGAVVRNQRGKDLGIVSDDGLAWITGVNPKETLSLVWNNEEQCTATLPEQLMAQRLLLPCQM